MSILPPAKAGGSNTPKKDNNFYVIFNIIKKK
jgi:hypothetical protein